MERAPHRISKRVLGKWEYLVGEAVKRAGDGSWSSYNDREASLVGEVGSRFARSQESYVVPQSLSDQANIEAVMQAADEIGNGTLGCRADPHVARILFEHAFKLTQLLDPTSEGRGVLQFKTGLKSLIMQKRSNVDRSQDIRRIEEYYLEYKDNIEKGKPETRRRLYEFAEILRNVVDLLKEDDPEYASRFQNADTKRVMEEDAKKIEEFKPYNILPLETSGVNPFQNFPEVIGATKAFMYTNDLPRFPPNYNMPDGRLLDLFDFLHFAFGFQKDNVANQREHLIMLLASAESRMGTLSEQTREVYDEKLSEKAVINVQDRILSNYMRWCQFLRRVPQSTRANNPQKRLCLIALYLLVWGEAANLRFIPECLCYIFHNMADECFDLLDAEKRTYVERARTVDPAGNIEFSFLEQVITPVYDVVAAESKLNEKEKGPHSEWRNYDDFNEFFWQPSCFELEWPWRTDKGFFIKPKPKKKDEDKAVHTHEEGSPLLTRGGHRRVEHKESKVLFVEHRSGLHLYHSFHRLWIFFICMLQGLIIWAFCSKHNHLNLNARTIKRILSVGVTFVIMKFIQSVLDVAFMWGAFRSTRKTSVSRIFIRLLWFICLSGVVLFLYVRALQEDVRNPGSTAWFRIYYMVLAVYAGLQVLFTGLLRLPFFRKQTDKCSNVYAFQFIKWIYEERYYTGRGLYENTKDFIKYSLFWIFVLFCKFAFTMHFQILPLVEPTRLIIGFNNITYEWFSVISRGHHNAFTVLAIWAPVVMIYFLDVQVWYTVISALLGGLEAGKDKQGEIRELDMLRRKFTAYPEAFVQRLQPLRSLRNLETQGSEAADEKAIKDKEDAIRFLPIWNAVIQSLREEDFINNLEKGFLEMPSNNKTFPNGAQHNLICWPLFLLANKVHLAVEIAVAEENKKAHQNDLWEKIKNVEYMAYAVQESFQTLQQLLLYVLNPDGRRWVIAVLKDVNEAISSGAFAGLYNLSQLREILKNIRELTEVLGKKDVHAHRKKAMDALKQLSKVVMNDFPSHESSERIGQSARYEQEIREGRLFGGLRWPDRPWQEQAIRLNNLLKVHKIKDSDGKKEKLLNTESIPLNLEARRRLQFFTNSLFMHMPPAPPISKMFSFCVFTPYYEEDVMYDLKKTKAMKKAMKKADEGKKDDGDVKALDKKNEDGISTLFYLQKIYPDQWDNFLERMDVPPEFRSEKYHPEQGLAEDPEHKLELRLWASYRGQTLARTVRGMMYYKKALELQAEQERSFTPDIEKGRPSSSNQAQTGSSRRDSQAQAELKFTYVVTCQKYGEQKKKGQDQAADILYLMQQNDSLRIAYVDIVPVGQDKIEYYSKLVKVDKTDINGKDQIIYSIKLPGNFKLGEGKPENQNHAIVFTRGDCIQTIDMNQDNFLEEALKMRNLLEEFDQPHGLRRPTILGVREHVFTGSVSSLAWFMSMQESSFVTLGQRVLARPLKVRMHYGHPDVFDRIFHISTGGISKASRGINLSEDIFAGFNTTLRQGNVTHHEYIQVGKGRDVGLNQIAIFEAKVASGNGEQVLSRDVYRLGQLLDFPRMLSFFFTSVGFYVTTMMTVLTLYLFLYGKAYLALSGVDASLKANNDILQNSALQTVLNTQFLVQIGIFTAVPMIVNLILEQGILKALIHFLIMQLQLASVFFTFSLGTRTHYFGRIILHGGAKYLSTGRGFVVRHIKFAENYRLFSRSHFTKAFEIIMLLVVYLAYGAEDRTSTTYLLLTFSSWFLAISWLFAPYIFNPSGFEWQKTVEDFENWTDWLTHKGGIGVDKEKSWEAWWMDEQKHLCTTGGKFWEIVLSVRFFFFQFGVVYHLHVDRGNTSIMVYVYSWILLFACVLVFKIFSYSQKAGARKAKINLLVRMFQGALFLALVLGVILVVVLSTVTFGDVFAVALALIPTGWGLLSIAIVFQPLMKAMGLWKSIREIARFYDGCMGIVIFIPIIILSWFSFVSTFQTRLIFNQAFSQGLEIHRILAGNRANVQK